MDDSGRADRARLSRVAIGPLRPPLCLRRSPETAKSASPTGPMAGGGSSDASTATARPDASGVGPLAIEHVTPSARASRSGGSGLAALGERPAMRTPAEVPKVYRSRVEPDRPTRARLAGASAASEQAVERALDWLARHQDPDGRWDAAVARYDDGTPVQGDDDFTAHCPGDEVCSGVCAYWEADTALTGLALLAYLGAGYTHLDGQYTETVDKGSRLPPPAAEARRRPPRGQRGRRDVLPRDGHAGPVRRATP